MHPARAIAGIHCNAGIRQEGSHEKIQALLGAAAAALAFAGTAAHADTLWNFTYSGGSVSASGSFTLEGNGSSPSLVDSMSGTYTDGTTTGSISLIPTGAGAGTTVTSADGLYYYDDMFGGSPSIDNGGLSFSAGTQEVNLYLDSSTGLTNVTSYGGYVFTPVTFSAVAVPEPGSLAMLLAGVAALGFVSRRKARG